jgi:hypothetical protein
MAERRKVLVVGAVALFVAIAVIIAVDYLERQAEDAGYVVTPRGDEPLEFAEGVNPYAPDIPADYEGEISDERLREYVQEIEDYYSGSNNREGVEYMITEVAIIAKNAEPCANLKTQDIKDSCYYGVALEALDPSPCANVIFGRADCYMIIAEQTGDETLCEKANYEYEVCLEAARTKDMSLCQQVGDFRQYCNSAAFPGCSNDTFEGCSDAAQSEPPGDIKECDNMPDYKGACYYRVATNYKKPSLCAKAAEDLKENCYGSIAIETNNANMCSLAGNLKDTCISWVAFNTDDISLCAAAGAEKEVCEEDLYFKWSE